MMIIDDNNLRRLILPDHQTDYLDLTGSLLISALVRIHRSLISSTGIPCRQVSPRLSVAMTTPPERRNRARADVLTRRRNIFKCSRFTHFCCILYIHPSATSSPSETPSLLFTSFFFLVSSFKIFLKHHRLTAANSRGISVVMSSPHLQSSFFIPPLLLSPPTSSLSTPLLLLLFLLIFLALSLSQLPSDFLPLSSIVHFFLSLLHLFISI